jgi:hypothetical protein
MTLKLAGGPRCANGGSCVAYSVLGQPAKLSRGNPGPRCFACEERRVASMLKVASTKEEVVERGKTNEPSDWGKSSALDEHAGREHTRTARPREVLERRRRSVLTCEQGLRTAFACGDERLTRRWSRSLRDAQLRLAWAEEDLARAETAAQSEHARLHDISEATSSVRRSG